LVTVLGASTLTVKFSSKSIASLASYAGNVVELVLKLSLKFNEKNKIRTFQIIFLSLCCALDVVVRISAASFPVRGKEKGKPAHPHRQE